MLFLFILRQVTWQLGVPAGEPAALPGNASLRLLTLAVDLLPFQFQSYSVEPVAAPELPRTMPLGDGSKVVKLLKKKKLKTPKKIMGVRKKATLNNVQYLKLGESGVR